MAGFNTAVTGLKSASQMLDVAGNNIANSSTVGFKSTRTEFADIYATSVVGAGASNQPGSGVTVSDVSQDFSAGTIEFTNNNLDLAINGSGFFQLNDGQGGITYTRAGSFELDKDGFIVSKNGKFLQGYGLDTEGNQLPIQNLSVTQKESPPKATESIGLSFNIDSSADAQKLARTFDKDNPASYTYSTTVETVDSLGNSNSIRFYMVEQAAKRMEYSYTVSDTADISISGITIPQANLASGIEGTPLGNQLAVADERIDISSVRLVTDAGVTTLQFELFASDTNAGDMLVGPAASLSLDAGYPSERDSNHKVSIPIVSGAAPRTSISMTIGGVAVELQGNYDTVDDIGEALESFESALIDRNPDIKSVTYNPNSLPDASLEITYKAEAGEISQLIKVEGTSAGAILGFSAQQTSDDFVSVLDVGDNSYLGTYRVYAYLNDEVALDIGKERDPAETTGTEVGPILLKFDPTSGQLAAVNRIEANGGVATAFTILGADPANPGDTDGISVDFTGASQFASESIVKAATQDGYPKGDLIGVTFAETGEMVASFSNGQRQNLGLVTIASFENQAGLASAGSTEWIATLNSGAAILNPPGTGLNGTLRSAALESSNVDLSAELVKLIEAQRNFQANSKTLETQNTVTQAILQI